MFAFTLATLQLLALWTLAADIRGRVVNGTIRRPAAGDEVVLLSLTNDTMNERAHTRTNRAGRFQLPVADPEMAHVVRVVHQGVTYHQIAQPGANAVVLDVYDVTCELEDVSAVMDVERFEAVGDRLEVKQLVTMRNESKPPRTLLKDRSFEFELPPEAQVQYGLVQVEDGQPLKQKPILGDHHGRYYFVFPLRPGDTRFAVVYRVPYTGQATIQPTIRNPQERFVVMLPNAMKFEAADPQVFQPMAGTTPDNVQGTGPVAITQTISFRISGTGMLAELEGQRQAAKKNQQNQTASMPQPGGGLGAPIDAPDPLQQYRWAILGGMATVLLAGGAFVARGHRLGRIAPHQSVSHPTPVRQIATQAQRRTSIPGNCRKRQRSQPAFSPAYRRGKAALDSRHTSDPPR